MGEHTAGGKKGDLGDLGARGREYEQPIGARDVGVRARDIAAEGGLAVGPGRDDPHWRSAGRRAFAKEPRDRSRNAFSSWVRVDKEYRFETDEGTASLADLFRGHSQLLIYHVMFGPEYTAGCPSCSAIADGFDGSMVHLANHDVRFCAISRAPLAKLQAYKGRMGWSFPGASSFDSDFNYDFEVTHTKEQWESGATEYNFRAVDFRPAEESPVLAKWASSVGTDFATYRREGPGLSAFALEDGVVYHTYSAYERGLDGLWGMYQWLDRAPLGRNEAGFWWRRHDEYQ